MSLIVPKEIPETPHKIQYIQCIDPQPLPFKPVTNSSERNFVVGDLTIAGKCWGDEDADIKILGLHGFMDNAATWSNLAPLLISEHPDRKDPSIYLVAIDFSGHGKSSHRPKSSPYHLTERCVEVQLIADSLGWNKFILLGHSMGGLCSVLYASAMRNRVSGLILIDSFGPTVSLRPGQKSIHDHDPSRILRDHMLNRYAVMKRHRRVYDSLEAAVQRHSRSTTISVNSSRLLVERGTEQVEVRGLNGSLEGLGVCFSHDPRLRQTPIAKFPFEDCKTFTSWIRCPILLMVAHSYGENQTPRWHGPPEVHEQVWDHIRGVDPKRLDLCVVEDVNHHFHLDNAELIYERVLDFLADKIRTTGDAAGKSKL